MVFFSLSCIKPEHLSPKLVVLIVAELVMPYLLTRYDKLYTGGFRWLIDHGISFTNTHHEHSNTLTGPGFFVIGTGRYPNSEGIWGNKFYDRILGKTVNCVEDAQAKPVGGEGEGRS